MKKSIFLAALVLLLSTGADAQSAGVRTPTITGDSSSLVAISAVANASLHANFQFYYWNMWRDTMTIMAQIFRVSDSFMVNEYVFTKMAGSAAIDTGFTVPTAGVYLIKLWGFSKSGPVIDGGNTLVTIFDKTAVEIVSEEINPFGEINYFSLNGKKIFSKEIFFEERNKIMEYIPTGMYIREFISKPNSATKQKHATEKVFVY